MGHVHRSKNRNDVSTQEIAQQMGLRATFMAKPFGISGSAGECLVQQFAMENHTS